MGDRTGKPLEELASKLTERQCRTKVYGGTLVVCPPFSMRGERVIACDGTWFRWGSEIGQVFGLVSDVVAAVDRAVSVVEAGTP